MKRIDSYKNEKEILTKTFGELSKGKVITTELSDLGEIIPRRNIQIKSYDGLVNYIARTTGAQIHITSQRGGKGYASE